MPMNDYYVLKKEKLKSFLRAAMGDFCLIGPVEEKNNDFLLQETEDPEKINLNYDTASNSLKEFLFPRREKIFSYESRPGALTKIIPAGDTMRRPIIFFGVRSCDIRAVYFLDLFFGREPRDMPYLRKRNKSILISLACNRPPMGSCFCVYTNKSGPFLQQGEGFDLQFIDLSSDYLVEVGSSKGKMLIKKYIKFFMTAGKDAVNKIVVLKEACLSGFALKYDLAGVRNKLKNANLHEVWKELGKRCTNCGGCEFICPTCFCFYQQDLKSSKDKGERIRAWDSCTFIGYSRMAGDSATHEKNSDRVSRRFFCKLYNCYSWFGVFGCTGCGRCSFVCPVNLDMESFIRSFTVGGAFKPLLKEL